MPFAPTPPAATTDPKEWSSTELVRRIQADELAAKNEFYRRFERGMRYFALRMGTAQEDSEDHVHDTIFLALRQIQAGQLHEPEKLPGYMRTILKRRILEQWHASGRLDPIAPEGSTGRDFHDQSPNPEQQVLIAEKSVVMRRALQYMSAFHVELLTRFYLQGQKEEQIRAEMNMSENVFRIEKSRAKMKLTEAVHQIVAGKTPRKYRELVNRYWEKAA